MIKIKLSGLLILSAIFVISCSGNNSEKEEIYGSTLNSLVDSALKGSIAANQRLSGLIDSDKIIQQNYNKLKIDSTLINGNKFFSVLVEYPNPKLNLLAIYDNYLNFYFLDKSLNGNLAEEWKDLDGKTYLIVSEKFISKDILKLGRTSFYALDQDKWKLTFRFFNRFEIDDKVYTQEIQNFSDDEIRTIIKSTDSRLTETGDVFTFNTDSGKYISERNIFTIYVEKQIKDYNWIPTKTQLTSSKNQDTKPYIHKSDYSLSITPDWKEIDDMTLTSKFHQDLFGDRFVNPGLGASISVANIDYVASAEDFCKFTFNIRRSVNYVIRDSGLIEQNIYAVRIMEHSCNHKKYLLIFECSKYSYEKNKEQLDKILNSFSIRC